MNFSCEEKNGPRKSDMLWLLSFVPGPYPNIISAIRPGRVEA
jgi:hypothetical protein